MPGGADEATMRRFSPAEIEVVDYDPEWPRVFEELVAPIRAALGDLALSIEHVGSTSVPGLAAKPIVDIDVVIRSAVDLAEVAQRLAPLGYKHLGDLGLPGREAFGREDGAVRPQRHLCVCIQGARPLVEHLLLRDYLRSHPEDAERYAAVKRELAVRFRLDREGYVEAKSGMVQELLAAAERGSKSSP